MSEEEKEAIEYFEDKIKNKLPLYEETYVDGKPYRRNILQLETNFTEEQANKTEILLNLIDKLQKENEELSESNFQFLEINQKLIEEKPMIKKLTEKELNLLEEIDKLQKENEELKGIKNGTTIEYIGKATYWRKDKIEKYFISKDIIRNKIKELEEELIQNYGTLGENLTTTEIKALKKLLGE